MAWDTADPYVLSYNLLELTGKDPPGRLFVNGWRW